MKRWQKISLIFAGSAALATTVLETRKYFEPIFWPVVLGTAAVGGGIAVAEKRRIDKGMRRDREDHETFLREWELIPERERIKALEAARAHERKVIEAGDVKLKDTVEVLQPMRPRQKMRLFGLSQ